jgi:hypothetical protein
MSRFGELEGVRPKPRGDLKGKNIMVAIEAENLRLPLCPVQTHFNRMESSGVMCVAPDFSGVEMILSFRCTGAECPYMYSLSSGYFIFCQGEPIRTEKCLWHLCPLHRRPLYISERDLQRGKEAWRCPELGCEWGREISREESWGEGQTW